MKDTELLTGLLEKAKTDKKTLKHLKAASIQGQQYALAAQLRDIEKEAFPESQEAKAAKQEAHYLTNLFAMVGLSVPESAAWLISQTLKKHSKRKGNFDLKDAAILKAKTEQLFDEQAP